MVIKERYLSVEYRRSILLATQMAANTIISARRLLFAHFICIKNTIVFQKDIEINSEACLEVVHRKRKCLISGSREAIFELHSAPYPHPNMLNALRWNTENYYKVIRLIVLIWEVLTS